MASKKKPRPRQKTPQKEVTVRQALSTWQMIATAVGGAAVIGGAVLWLLSTQFAKVEHIKAIKDSQGEVNYRLETKDIAIDGAMSLMKAEDAAIKNDVGSVKSELMEVKSDVKEVRKEQQQTNENLIRLMERFSVPPAPKAK